MTLTRRQFMIGCSTAIAAMAGSRIGGLVFDDHAPAGTAYAAGSDDILVTVFLRGGCDGLSLVAPYDDATYRDKRGSLALALPGQQNGALQLAVNNAAFSATSSFGLHPGGAGLKELYDAGHLAIVHACGLNDDTRSHFDAMDYMERGTPGNKATSTGWLTRHLECVNPAGLVPTIAASSNAPTSLLAEREAVALTSPQSYSLSAVNRYESSMFDSLTRMYPEGDLIQSTGHRTLEAMSALKSAGAYTPEATAAYPRGSFGDSLKTVAQMIKMDVGLRIATVDLGGWDHHENQGVNGGTFASLADVLSRGLSAFYNDLPNQRDRLTVVVMSEFGRRLGRNASDGTDHGHGNVMLVMGGKVRGGKLYGAWPGLLDLDQDQDLKVTTDYRRVLSEVLIRRLGNPKLGVVFPGYTNYTPLGILEGADLPVDYSSNAHNLFVPLANR